MPPWYRKNTLSLEFRECASQPKAHIDWEDSTHVRTFFSYELAHRRNTFNLKSYTGDQLCSRTVDALAPQRDEGHIVVGQFTRRPFVARLQQAFQQQLRRRQGVREH